MGDQTKKISFGFSKLVKKPTIVSTNQNKEENNVSKVEFIDCLEGKSIKLKDHIEVDRGPLIIPLTRTKESNRLNSSQPNNSDNVQSLHVKNESNTQLTTKSSESVQRKTTESGATSDLKTNESQNKHETLDEIAVREILEELNKKKTEEEEKRVFSVPLTSNAPSGEKESTLDDYDNIPVTEFGMAMLRGMGWAPGKGIGKNEKLVAPSLPTPRPKGMGLGADKVMKSVINKNSNEDLKMVKGSFVRILAGPEKDSYGQIEGFDDESGRLIVKLALKNNPISLNEFMVQLVDRNEFQKNSKVINVSKYEQYKEDEVKKEASENKSQMSIREPIDKPLGPGKNSLEKISNSKSKAMKKTHSSESEEEYRYRKDNKAKSSTSRYPDDERNSSRRSRSPYNRNSRRNESPRSQFGSPKPQSQHKIDAKQNSRSSNNDKKPTSYSSDSSGSPSSLKINRHDTSNYRKNKSPIHEIIKRRQRSSSKSSLSSSDSSETYSRKKKNKHKKKKSSSTKYRSRSRSRSPRKHKHKKSKRHRD